MSVTNPTPAQAALFRYLLRVVDDALVPVDENGEETTKRAHTWNDNGAVIVTLTPQEKRTFDGLFRTDPHLRTMGRSWRKRHGEDR